jgi:hypothetical protein
MDHAATGLAGGGGSDGTAGISSATPGDGQTSIEGNISEPKASGKGVGSGEDDKGGKGKGISSGERYWPIAPGDGKGKSGMSKDGGKHAVGSKGSSSGSFATGDDPVPAKGEKGSIGRHSSGQGKSSDPGTGYDDKGSTKRVAMGPPQDPRRQPWRQGQGFANDGSETDESMAPTSKPRPKHRKDTMEEDTGE